MLRKRALLLIVVVSALFIAVGAYVFSSVTEVKINDGAHQLGVEWFQPPVATVPSATGPAGPILDLQGSISDRTLRLTGLIDAEQFDHSAAPPLPFGDLFLDLDGQGQYVFDLNFEDMAYRTYRLDGFEPVIQRQTDPVTGRFLPYRYIRGGGLVGSGGFSFSASGGSGGGGGGISGGGEAGEAGETGPDDVEFVLDGLPLPELEDDLEGWASFTYEPGEEGRDDFGEDGSPKSPAGSPAPVPEPSTLLLLCVGIAAVGWMRRKR